MNTSRHYKFVLLMIIASMVMFSITVSADNIHQENTAIQELVLGNTEFALDFFQMLIGMDNSNFVFSPYSLSNAFAMTFAGARGNTATEIQETFHFSLPPEDLHRAFSELTIGLNNPERTSRVVVANAIWGERSFQFRPEYQQLMLTRYSNGFRPVDFANLPEEATNEINQWVNNLTEGRIDNIIPPGTIDNLTRLVIANALLFKADWLTPFDSSETRDGSFYTFDGEISVPMMNGKEMPFNCLIAEDEEFEFVAIELPYADESASLVVIMPYEKSYDDFLSVFTGDTFFQILYGMDGCFGNVTMPKFSVQTKLDLNEILLEMGVVDAFSPTADFSGMTGAPELYITKALHQARIDVTEKGTEAAASTAVIAGVRGAAMEVIIDGPFFFAVVDSLSDTILFMGNVVDPSGT